MPVPVRRGRQEPEAPADVLPGVEVGAQAVVLGADRVDGVVAEREAQRRVGLVERP